MLTFYTKKKYKKSGRNVANVQITGYSFSDQYIFSPINPKYDDWFCQIYKDLYKLLWEIQNLQNLCFEFQNNLCKS